MSASPEGTATPAELQLFRSLLYSAAGLDLGPSREAFLLSRVRRRMRHVGARSLYDYYRRLSGLAPGSELMALLDDVAIHETSFFRTPQQFALLSERLLPERQAARLRAGQRCLRVWSAGCSTGQEVDSLAIVLHETLVPAPSWELLLLGTDVSERALGEARRGLYPSGQLDGVSPERRRRFFDRRGERHAVRAWLRRGVRFAHGNLLDEAPAGDLDIVFCRNVMIYFDRSTQARLLARLKAALAPGGYLLLGHAESPAGLTDAFQMVSAERAIAYQRRA